MTFDAAVIGAGAAGLAAARALAEAGRTVILIEARDRIGGRAYTRFDARSPAPIELGAEFIHGTPRVTLDLLQQSGGSAVGAAGSAWERRNGVLQPASDSFDEAGALMQRLAPNAPDESVETFLERFRSDPSLQKARERMQIVVEGFDAADPRDASVQAIAQEWSGDASLRTSQARPSQGYGTVLEYVSRALPPDRVEVHLETQVRSIEYDDAGVRIEATRFGTATHIEARAAIVTLPIGVLQAGSIHFKPELPQSTRDAIAGIRMGPVIKVVLQFQTPFWRELHNGALADASFFFTENCAFPTFWTTYPIESPLLIAWAGGPRANYFKDANEDEIIQTALQEFTTLIRAETSTASLEAAYVHNWQRDPYSLGAYSYVKTNNLGARDALATPIGNTLLFAGEATASAGEAGTVAGALTSGYTAAQKLLAS